MMSSTSVFGFVLFAVMAIAIIGPSKLPAGVEGSWLAFTNFRRSLSDLEPWSQEEARRIWRQENHPLYTIVVLLKASTPHLLDLRRRILISVIGIVSSAVIAYVFIDQIFYALTLPCHDCRLIFLRIPEMVFTYFEVIFTTAMGLALPILISQLLVFLYPALENERERRVFKRLVFLGVPLVLFFFVAGVGFAYMVMLPLGLRFLLGFGSEYATPTLNIKDYISFVTGILFWIGFAFETPLVMALTSLLGLITPKQFIKSWRIAMVISAVLAAVITPTIDPINMAIVMGPLLLLYLIGILFARLAWRTPQASPQPA